MYSMYVVSTRGILLYEGIDRRDGKKEVQPLPQIKDYTLSPGAMDCTHQGKLVVDLKSMTKGESHQLRCYSRLSMDDKYNLALEGDKKILKFFG
mmetsp:Transcript_7878/g.12203  ORF Transcript_7878/g.12203 Transcript_7878/m.12203 type:complete len:94 (+) Transcript_7878:406-687(+)